MIGGNARSVVINAHTILGAKRSIFDFALTSPLVIVQGVNDHVQPVFKATTFLYDK